MKKSRKILIVAPNNNRPERKYAIDSLFSLIEVNYEIKFDKNAIDYTLSCEDFSVTIKDDFFGKYPQPLKYLDKGNIPQDTPLLELGAKNLVVIYGSPRLDHKKQGIECDLDIFASTFFMLTRWEEFVIEEKNALGKIVESELLSIKNQFYDRPVVNEYATFLCDIFQKYGYSIKTKNQSVEVLLTHDVDWVRLSSFRELFTNLRGIWRGGQHRRAVKVFSRYLRYRLQRNNPFDTFNDIMDYSDKYGFKNSFYFKACNKGEAGYTYQVDEPLVVDVIHNIEQRGHYIGFHPSEGTLDNPEQFNLEATRLHQASRVKIQGGRAHHLLYGYDSWRNWNDTGFEYDSSLGFQYVNGFRAGITSAFSMFDIKERRRLHLKQKPFLFMDSVWLRSGVSPEEFLDNAVYLIEIVAQYGGVVCANWHSNLFSSIETKDLHKVYFQIVDYLGERSEKQETAS